MWHEMLGLGLLGLTHSNFNLLEIPTTRFVDILNLLAPCCSSGEFFDWLRQRPLSCNSGSEEAICVTSVWPLWLTCGSGQMMFWHKTIRKERELKRSWLVNLRWPFCGFAPLQLTNWLWQIRDFIWAERAREKSHVIMSPLFVRTVFGRIYWKI